MAKNGDITVGEGSVAFADAVMTSGRPAPAPAVETGPSGFAARLVRLRVAAGLSQTALAGEDLSPSYISLLESGKRSPSADVVERLARRLGCSLNALQDGRPSERERRIELEIAYSRLALAHGEAKDARDRLSTLLAEESLGRQQEDDALLYLGRSHEALGDLPAAIANLLPVFDRARRGQSHLPICLVGIDLCSCYRDAGDHHRSVEVGQLAFDSAVAQGLAGTEDYYRLAATLMWSYHEAGDLLHAATWAQSLIAEVETSGPAEGQGAIFWNAALIAEGLGRLDQALHLSQRALARMGEGTNSRDLARLRVATAVLMLSTEPPQVTEAWHTLQGARETIADLGSQADRAQWENAAAVAQIHRGEIAEAEELSARAWRRVGADDHSLATELLISRGDVAVAGGRSTAARAHYRDARSRLGQVAPSRATARLWRELGDRLRESGEAEDALECYEGALSASGINDRSVALRAAIRRHNPQVPEQRQ